MPYLTPENKDSVEKHCSDNGNLYSLGTKLLTAGELNYTITRIIQGYFRARGGRYQQINDIVGALESAKVEFQRRIVGPYEDKKIKENGDVQ